MYDYTGLANVVDLTTETNGSELIVAVSVTIARTRLCFAVNAMGDSTTLLLSSYNRTTCVQRMATGTNTKLKRSFPVSFETP